MLRHPLGQANGAEGLGPVVDWVVFNGCVPYRWVSPCRGSGPSSRVSARECVRGVAWRASAASRMTSRRLHAPSPRGGSRHCGTPCWAMKRRACAPPPAPRRCVLRQREISARTGKRILKGSKPPVHPTAELEQQSSAMCETSVGAVTHVQRWVGSSKFVHIHANLNTRGQGLCNGQRAGAPWNARNQTHENV